MLTQCSAPIWEAVQYERKIFYANQEDSAQFMGEPRQELDDAWANITNGMDHTLGV